MSRTFGSIFDCWFWSLSKIFLITAASTLLSWLRTLSDWSLALLYYVILYWLFLILPFFNLSLSFILIRRSRVGGSSIREKTFLLSLIFHHPFMDGRTNFFSFFLLLLPRAFLHAGATQRMTPIRTVRWRPMIRRTSSDWRTWQYHHIESWWSNKLSMTSDLVGHFFRYNIVGYLFFAFVCFWIVLIFYFDCSYAAEGMSVGCWNLLTCCQEEGSN